MKQKSCSLSRLVPHAEITYPVDWEEKFDRKAPLVLEIGFGQGEVLIKKAQENPDVNFVGIEIMWERVYKAIRSMKLMQTWINHPLRIQSFPDHFRFNNVQIVDIDASFGLEQMFEEKSLDHVYCLFPCPWPKTKHARHRLFSTSFLRVLNNKLKDNCDVQLVTDDLNFHYWVVGQLKGFVDDDFENYQYDFEDQNGFSELTRFHFSTRKIEPQFDSKFEKKWRTGGQNVFYELCLKKESHLDFEIKGVEKMKSFKVDQFDPANFRFEKITGDLSVVQKDFLFDEKRQKGQVTLVVSEEHLTQYLRVNIIKKEGSWRIYAAEGQTFFPTNGMNIAVEKVYESIES